MSARSRLRPGDALALGGNGLRSRPLRVVLSALGIAIGIAAMIAVVGISTSGQARLNAEFARLGTNLLTITPGKDLVGADVKLPAGAPDAVRRLSGVTDVSAIGLIENVPVYRSALIDKARTAGLGIAVADERLPGTVGATLRAGTWLNEATSGYPAVVLGATAAERLGVVRPGVQVLIGDEYHTVVGILDPVALAPELDTLALVGAQNARERLGYDGSPTTVFERSADEDVSRLREILPSAVDPEKPGQVAVSRPSDALAAKHATDQAFTGLLVGLGSVALLVGGIGVANTMIISVLERRREIGLRRALGATRAHIRVQFLTEALLLSLLGGIVGSAIGLGVTAVFAAANGWLLSIPPGVFAAAIGTTLAIGAVAGLYPAIRAARLPPTAALSAQ
ncbi:putative ABC transport system permease protein [Microbacterium resistens]|uniref:ABC transport system permease protein n=1 Tax=Microbacterium resistens TaxID=156977 RepID=A0ABU1SEI2_9MICO|nr:ABC transporter permease [Microbacterium resistens]MDR6868017.1 putative ABC transport system permease protein [Microbacterium resistens]